MSRSRGGFRPIETISNTLQCNSEPEHAYLSVDIVVGYISRVSLSKRTREKIPLTVNEYASFNTVAHVLAG